MGVGPTHLENLIDQFLDYLVAERGASPATVSAYSDTLRRLLRFLAGACAKPGNAGQRSAESKSELGFKTSAGIGLGMPPSSRGSENHGLCRAGPREDGRAAEEHRASSKPGDGRRNNTCTRQSFFGCVNGRLDQAADGPVRYPCTTASSSLSWPDSGFPASGSIHFDQITTADLRASIASLRRDGLSAASIARHVHAIRSFWRFVVETYDLSGNAALPLRAPKPERRIPDILSEDECLRLLDATTHSHYRLDRVRDRVLLKLMLVTGLRRSEDPSPTTTPRTGASSLGEPRAGSGARCLCPRTYAAISNLGWSSALTATMRDYLRPGQVAAWMLKQSTGRCVDSRSWQA